MGIEMDESYDQIAKDVQQQVTITSLSIIKDKVVEGFVQNFAIKIALSSVEIFFGRVEVLIDDKVFSAYSPLDFTSLYQRSYIANVTVKIPIPFAGYVFKAEARAILENKIISSKSINIFVNEDGLIEKTNKPLYQNSQNFANENLEGCGIEFRNKVKCTRYNKHFGPVFNGKLKMQDYKGLSDLVNNGIISPDEKQIIIAMSENEANLDGINAYDNQIVTVGAMQKTVTPDGYGELPIQIWEFKEEYPEMYKKMLENCGWTVSEETEGKTPLYRMYYNNVTGKRLFNFLREGCDSTTYGKFIKCIPLESLINLCNNKEFQAKQIVDFITRLNASLEKIPTGYKHKINKFVKSKLGKATVLDHDVNRPAHVKKYFGTALDMLMAKTPAITKDPAQWGENHETYEAALLDIYGPLRGQKLKGSKGMTDGAGRYKKLKTKL